MRRLLRRVVRAINDLSFRFLCETFGDKAELHAGPCQRCVGKAAVGPMELHLPVAEPSSWR